MSELNFEKPLRAAWNKIHKWNKRHLTLLAKILVAKTFIFSLFTHILNTTWVVNVQLDLIQRILNKFVWSGQCKIRFKIACSPVSEGGLNMINVKSTMQIMGEVDGVTM